MEQKIEVKTGMTKIAGYRIILCEDCHYRRIVDGVACCTRFPEATADQKLTLSKCEDERSNRVADWGGGTRPACYHYARYFTPKMPESEAEKPAISSDTAEWVIRAFVFCLLAGGTAGLVAALVCRWIR